MREPVILPAIVMRNIENFQPKNASNRLRRKGTAIALTGLVGLGAAAGCEGSGTTPGSGRTEQATIVDCTTYNGTKPILLDNPASYSDIIIIKGDDNHGAVIEKAADPEGKKNYHLTFAASVTTNKEKNIQETRMQGETNPNNDPTMASLLVDQGVEEVDIFTRGNPDRVPDKITCAPVINELQKIATDFVNGQLDNGKKVDARTIAQNGTADPDSDKNRVYPPR